MDSIAHQAPLSMKFSRKEYWSGLPFPPPGDLSNLGAGPESPALQADFLTLEPSASSHLWMYSRDPFVLVLLLYNSLKHTALWLWKEELQSHRYELTLLLCNHSKRHFLEALSTDIRTAAICFTVSFSTISDTKFIWIWMCPGSEKERTTLLSIKMYKMSNPWLRDNDKYSAITLNLQQIYPLPIRMGGERDLRQNPD